MLLQKNFLRSANVRKLRNLGISRTLSFLDFRILSRTESCDNRHLRSREKLSFLCLHGCRKSRLKNDRCLELPVFPGVGKNVEAVEDFKRYELHRETVTVIERKRGRNNEKSNKVKT
ncbi:hypothetical protein AVEN_81121-1 [Araneus ventricosus]|uniref:Uncharacterized protein n=1 Tax=Araneus ventricosus TaxID=182803 RepID=A0A4Y2RU79_ARAVE|nr:hypothetical protein AVEN_81121-1 [Araneus ventricosus]